MKKICTCVIVVVSLLCFVSQASATNGYFAHGYSIKNKALAGAGAALPLDALANSTNPAGMALVGDRLDFGLTFFNPNREYTVKGQPSGFPGTFGLAPGTVESDSEWFVIPAIGFNKILNEKHALGVSLYGNGGMNTDYDTNTFGGSKSTGVDLSQLFITTTYAIKVHPKHSLGVSFILAYQSSHPYPAHAVALGDRIEHDCMLLQVRQVHDGKVLLAIVAELPVDLIGKEVEVVFFYDLSQHFQFLL